MLSHLSAAANGTVRFIGWECVQGDQGDLSNSDHKPRISNIPHMNMPAFVRSYRASAITSRDKQAHLLGDERLALNELAVVRYLYLPVCVSVCAALSMPCVCVCGFSGRLNCARQFCTILAEKSAENERARESNGDGEWK